MDYKEGKDYLDTYYEQPPWLCETEFTVLELYFGSCTQPIDLDIFIDLAARRVLETSGPRIRTLAAARSAAGKALTSGLKKLRNQLATLSKAS